MREGVRKRPGHCSLALAVRDVIYPEWQVNVHAHRVTIYDSNGRAEVYETDDRLARVIRKFDDGYGMEPMAVVFRDKKGCVKE